MFSSRQDQVSLSGISKLLGTQLVDHNAKIGRLQALVRSGNYEPSTAELSRSLVSETLARGDYRA